MNHNYRDMNRATRSQEFGFGLVESIVALALASIAGYALMSQTKSMMGSARKIGSTSDLSSMGARISESVSCRATFASTGGTPGNPCVGGSFVTLRNEAGAVIVAAAGQNYGPWTVRARCNAGAQSLEVRAARLSPGAPVLDFPVPPAQYNPTHYIADEAGGMNQLVTPNRPLRYDWEHPKSLLAPVGAGGLCNDWFAAPTTPTVQRCANNQILIGIDRVRNTPICQTFSCTGDLTPTFSMTNPSSPWTCTRNAMSDAELINVMNSRIQTVQTPPATTIANQRINALVPGWTTQRVNSNNQNVVLPRDNSALNQARQYTQAKFDYMASGPTYDLIQSSDQGCVDWPNHQCRTGYYIMAVEFRQASAGNNCRVRCRKIER